MRHEIVVYYDLKILSKKGRVIRHVTGKSRSIVQQWLICMAACAPFTNPGTSATDITNTSRSLGRSALNGQLQSNAVNSSVGPVVGSGTTPVLVTDYKLASQIAHGTGVGNLSYQQDQITPATVVGTSTQFQCSRMFINNTAAPVVIREVGMYMIYPDSGLTAQYFCQIRDVLPSSYTVGIGLSAVLTYTYKTFV